MRKITLLIIGVLFSITVMSQPPVPTGLSLTPLSATSMRASWNASPGAEIYYVMLTDNATCPNFDDKPNECQNYFDAPQISVTTWDFTGLQPGTTYWLIVAAVDVPGYSYDGVAKISAGTATETASLPVVTTDDAISVSGNSATLGGEVTDDGNDPGVERGVIYSSSNTTPTVGGAGVTQNSNGTGTGTFNETISGFTESSYYFRAYATNVAGTSYGTVKTFSFNTPPVANNDSYTRFYTNTGVSFTVNAPGVLSNDDDDDGDPLTVGIPRPATGVPIGFLILNSNGSFTYTSTNGFRDGSDSFTYYANDGTENSNSTATVTINVVTPRFVGPGNDFNDGNNWNTGYAPTESGLDIIIADGQHINFNQSYTCENLTFESATSSFSCTSPYTLTITGNVIDGNGKVAIGVNSSLVVSSSIEIPQSGAPPF